MKHYILSTQELKPLLEGNAIFETKENKREKKNPERRRKHFDYNIKYTFEKNRLNSVLLLVTRLYFLLFCSLFSFKYAFTNNT